MVSRILTVVLLIAVLCGSLLLWRNSQHSRGRVSANPVIEARLQSTSSDSARKLGYKVVASYPHDPEAFTQGLVWQDGRLYESTGQYGQSSLRQVELKSGRVLKKLALSPQYFGEGLALANGRLYQITWQSGQAFLYDLQFKQLNTYRYEGEGWGITFNGTSLIMSDGSDTLTYRNPQTFAPGRTVKVTMNGEPLRNLNELEYINGLVWANVWQTDYVVCIDPKTGVVRSYLDLRGLLPDRLRTGKENVLNGIAFDKKSRRILLGGKLWPRLFEIRIIGH